MGNKFTVTAQAGLRVRQSPDTASPIVTLLPYGSKVTAVNQTPAWAQFAVEVGGAMCGTGWASKQYLKSDDVIIPRGAEYLLGIHELAAGKVRKAFEMGCRAGMVFNDATEAIALSKSYPDAIVMHRVYFTDAPEPRDLLARHGIDINNKTPSDSRVYVRVFNENDSPGFNTSLDGIKRRAAYEREILLMLQDHAPSAKLVVGGFAHGNPDITNKQICDLIFELYGDIWAQGKIWIDLHNYSKAAPNDPHNYRYYGDEWLLARYVKWFTNCGLDPTIKQCLSSEAGIECGQGGVTWGGYTGQEFSDYCAYTLNVHRQEMLVNGDPYQNPLAAATFFQWGNDYSGAGGWAGYNLDRYINVFRSYWQTITRSAMIDSAAQNTTRAITLDNRPPIDYHPPIKKLIQSKRK